MSKRIEFPSIRTMGWKRKIFVLVALSAIMIIVFFQILPVRFSDGRELSTASNSQFIEHINQKIPELMEDYSIPGVSILIIKGRNPLWRKTYGNADVEQNRKMTGDTIFRVESISKPVAAWGVMKLAERGLINLDDPVQQYLLNWSLPESEYNPNEVTIRRLLSNSAGMPLGTVGEEYSPHSERPSLRQYLTKEAHLAYNPGSKFQYSNPGFNLLELLIEEVTGRDFSKYMEDEVLMPLEMYNSSFNWSEEWSSKVPVGYDLQGNSVSPYVYPYKASGGMLADIEDIARFTIAELTMGVNSERTVLSKQSIQQILAPQIETSGIFGFAADAYGFGHFIETLPDGTKAFWHGGQGHGWMTHFHGVPETGDGIVILTNSQRSWPLMGHILKDWSSWRGFGPVKFGQITRAIPALGIIIGLIFLVAFWRGVQVVNEIIVAMRKLKLSPEFFTKRRAAEFLLWILITAGLVWAVTRDYLFLTSIFPVSAIWLGWALSLLSVVLLASVLFPVVQEGESSSYNHL